MTRYGYFLSSEEYNLAELVRQAKLATEAGFDALWISDHFHRWLDEQGQSAFVWSVIGAVAQISPLPLPRQFRQLAKLVTEDMIYAGQVLPRLREV